MNGGVYFTFFSIGWLVLSVLFCVILQFCLAIKNKSEATKYLVLFFICAIIMSFSYMLSCSIYYPVSAIHRYFTVFSVLATDIYLCQFFLCFPVESHPRVRKILFAVMWIITLSAIAVFIIGSLDVQKVYHFDGHYWDIKLDDLSKIIGMVILLFVTTAIGTGIWQITVVKGRDRSGLVIIVIIYIVVATVPTFLNVLSRDGYVERGTYLLGMIFFTMFGYFLIFIVFINYTKDRTAFMAKIVSICLVTILPIFLVMGYFTNQAREKSYDEIHERMTTRLLMDHSYFPEDIEYILEYSIAGGDFKFYMNKNKALIDFDILKNQFLKISDQEKLKNDRRYYRTDITGQKHFISFIHYDGSIGKIYEAAFSYGAYRKQMNEGSLGLIFILILILFVVLALFPFFFRGVFVNPMLSLVEGLREVEKGNLDVFINVKVEDEIGFLSHNFNSMVSTIKKARKQIEDHTNTLEDKVNQRTLELQIAMEEVESANSMLIKARDELWGEMRLAKKIQTILLPDDPKISGYDLSSYTEPATEVGGDYYDIINSRNGDWIIIGDVSGHGVPAGLIMMMVQTAIRVAIDSDPDLCPFELLKIINQTISHNIYHVDSDMYMTITAILCTRNGQLIFSGLHQDILVYRADLESLEIVKTSGPWIGFYRNNDMLLENDNLTLGCGDVMLIYTDGITEAWRKDSEKDYRDPERDMFGSERLSKVFLDLGKCPTKDIIRGILDNMKDYEFHDDVTMVVIRRVE